VDLPDDQIDWDRYPGLRIEVWDATVAGNGNNLARLLHPDRGPYLVVPVSDPWRTRHIAVPVGQPGSSGFLLFVVAQDPLTGARVGIGLPDGNDALFHGSLLDWFAAL
jgi:hypothetical protein